MRKLIKDAQDNIAELVSLNGFIPDGWTEVPTEELEAEELTFAKTNKMASIRTKRDSWLLQNDKMWVIASKKAISTTNIESDATALRNLPEAAQAALDVMSTKEDVQAYDAFNGLVLNQSYE